MTRAIITACLLLFTVVTGCATTAVSAERPLDFTLEIFADHDGKAFVRYRVERTAMLKWAGGFNAVSKKYSWSGPLTEDEQATLIALVEPWKDGEPFTQVEPADVTYTVDVLPAGSVRRRHKIEGTSPELTPVLELLEAAAHRRLQPILDTLPRAGEQ